MESQQADNKIGNDLEESEYEIRTQIFPAIRKNQEDFEEIGDSPDC